jgi:hypothetical protein
MTPENSSPTSGDALEHALSALRALSIQRKAPTRHHARDLLLALGEAIRSGDEPRVERTLDDLRSIAPALGARWPAAVADELALACTEHVRSVDPRYLDHPQYDFEYTRSARDKLDLRLRAAERIRLPATAEWMSQVERADALLAEALQRRAARGGRR